MSRGYAELFTVRIGRSRTLFALLVLMHTLAMVAVLTVTREVPAALALLTLLAASAVFYLRRDALRNLKRSVVALRHRDDAVAGSIWELQFADGGTWHPATVCERFIHPLATVVLVRVAARRGLSFLGRSLGRSTVHSLVIVGDAIEAQAFAELRGRLRSVRGAKASHSRVHPV